jgi:hypothetical protein
VILSIVLGFRAGFFDLSEEESVVRLLLFAVCYRIVRARDQVDVYPVFLNANAWCSPKVEPRVLAISEEDGETPGV